MPPELTGAAGTARSHGNAEVPMRTTPRLFAAVLAVATATASRADVVEASSTTLVTAGQQLRGAQSGETPKLDTVVPVFEIISVTARELKNPLLDDLEVVVSGWGSYDLGEVRWNSGTPENFTGDLTTGYVRGKFLDRRVAVRAGRAYVAAGAGRMLQLDGGDLLIRLPGGVAVSGFYGLPVAQRFRTRAGDQSWNPAGGDVAYGGRLGWTLPLPGAYGRGLDVGASAVVVTDSGDTVREDAGLDLRFQPMAGLVFTGNGTWSLAADRLAEASVTALWSATSKLFVTADFRKIAPDLFLSQNSILAVFTDTERTDVGGGVRYQLNHSTSLGADYHVLIEPTGEGSKTELGQEAAARCEWERGDSRVGAELSYLEAGGLGAVKNGYVGGRLFGRQELGRAFVTGDVVGHVFKESINGNKNAVTGTVTAGYKLAANWSAVVAGSAGVTPFLEQQADLMVKLVYNQTYRVREVK